MFFIVSQNMFQNYIKVTSNLLSGLFISMKFFYLILDLILDCLILATSVRWLDGAGPKPVGTCLEAWRKSIQG